MGEFGVITCCRSRCLSASVIVVVFLLLFRHYQSQLTFIFAGYFWVSGGMYGTEIMAEYGPPGLVLGLLLLIPLIYVIPNSLIISDLSVAYPLDGGTVAWVEVAFGKTVGGHIAYWYVCGLFSVLCMRLHVAYYFCGKCADASLLIDNALLFHIFSCDSSTILSAFDRTWVDFLVDSAVWSI